MSFVTTSQKLHSRDNNVTEAIGTEMSSMRGNVLVNVKRESVCCEVHALHIRKVNNKPFHPSPAYHAFCILEALAGNELKEWHRVLPFLTATYQGFETYQRWKQKSQRGRSKIACRSDSRRQPELVVKQVMNL